MKKAIFLLSAISSILSAENVENNAHIQFERSQDFYYMVIKYDGHLYNSHMPIHSDDCECLKDD